MRRLERFTTLPRPCLRREAYAALLGLALIAGFSLAFLHASSATNTPRPVSNPLVELA